MITHSTAAKQAATDAIVDLVDVGSGTAVVRILTSNDDTLVDLPMSTPAFGSADTNGVATANSISTTAATGAGTAAKWQVRSKDDVLVFSGVVGKKHSISSVSTGSGSFTVNGSDMTSEFVAGERLNVVGSTGNDGRYVISSSIFTGGNTQVFVEEVVSDGTADGQIHVGEMGFDNNVFSVSQNIAILSFLYDAFDGD